MRNTLKFSRHDPTADAGWRSRLYVTATMWSVLLGLSAVAGMILPNEPSLIARATPSMSNKATHAFAMNVNGPIVLDPEPQDSTIAVQGTLDREPRDAANVAREDLAPVAVGVASMTH